MRASVLRSQWQSHRRKVLLAVSWGFMLAPARLLTVPLLWGELMRTGQSIVWVLVPLFLLYQVHRECQPVAGRPSWTGRGRS